MRGTIIESECVPKIYQRQHIVPVAETPGTQLSSIRTPHRTKIANVMADKESKTAGGNVPNPHPHYRARPDPDDDEEDDPVESMIKKTGCLELHYAVQECMADNRDWRKCQDEVATFKKCIADAAKRQMAMAKGKASGAS